MRDNHSFDFEDFDDFDKPKYISIVMHSRNDYTTCVIVKRGMADTRSRLLSNKTHLNIEKIIRCPAPGRTCP